MGGALTIMLGMACVWNTLGTLQRVLGKREALINSFDKHLLHADSCLRLEGFISEQTPIPPQEAYSTNGLFDKRRKVPNNDLSLHLKKLEKRIEVNPKYVH